VLSLSAAIGFALLYRWPFPGDEPMLQLLLANRSEVFYGIKAAYLTMLFTTPYILFSSLFSVLYIFTASRKPADFKIQLPSYPEAAARKDLYVVLGEVHQARRPEPVEHPRWLTIPSRGLYTGIAVFGAIGSGKTSGCMYPAAEQLFCFQAADKTKRVGGLILEVKGDFCHKVRNILVRAGRGEDYLEISLDTPYRYNPLHNELDAYALAYGIASLLNNLFGKGKEPFWQQAYTNLVKFVILLHKVLDGYVTFFDVYSAVINPDLLEQKIRQGEARFETRAVRICVEDFMKEKALEDHPFEIDAQRNEMRAPFSESLAGVLRKSRIAHQVEQQAEASDPALEIKHQQFEAVKRWFYQDWKRVDSRLRSSIVEGISVFLSLFDDNPAVKRVFCPPKETYDPVANADGRYGKAFPPFRDLVENGVVCALNLPLSANPGLARAIGTMIKQDFQRAVLNRIPRIEAHAGQYWRDVLFMCDEYHAFATAGENDPSGDEKFFALSRQAKCITIVATQSISSLRSTLPGESWRTLLQTFRTKVFLSLSDDFSARTASELCGKEEQLKPSYTISEVGQDAGVSMLTGRATAHRASLSTTKGYLLQRDFTFEPKVFSELRNAQAIVLAYDGVNPHPPTYCYLKPYYLDKNRSYFDQLEQGEL
jgi:hypothetical protein